MKPCLLIACLIASLTFRTSAQTRITAAESSKHIGEEVYVCDAVYLVKHERNSNSTLLILGDKHPNRQLTIVINRFNLDSLDYYKGRTVCVAGIIVNHLGKPGIEVTDSEMISVRKVAVLGKTGNGKHQKTATRVITSVQLTPPPNAHYFGDGYRTVSLKDIHKQSIDTIKIIEKISSYELTAGFARIDFGGLYPNQKLTVLLHGDAKKYFDAMLEIQYKGKELRGKEFMAIGKISLFEGKPQIIISDSNLFTFMRDL